MFTWFWKFLYSISKTIFRLIDGLMTCANILCGVEDVTVNGETTDFLTYLFRDEKVTYAFAVCSVIGIIVLVFFTIFAILRTITKEKVEGTPGQITVKALKAFLMFLFVPAIMLAGIWIGNTILRAVYQATSQGASSIGNFLFCSFAEDGGMDAETVKHFLAGDPGYDYTNTADVMKYMDISDYSFVFSWLAGLVILFTIGATLFMFVERVLSIIILYIVSPFSIASVVLDDGAHFKLWRDQILVKFIIGYGSIIAINVYMLVVSLAIDPSLQFFDNSFANLVMKLLLIGGGALTLRKSMALIGNLVSAGAGSQELRENPYDAVSLAKDTIGAGKFFGGLGAKIGWNTAKYGGAGLAYGAYYGAKGVGTVAKGGYDLASAGVSKVRDWWNNRSQSNDIKKQLEGPNALVSAMNNKSSNDKMIEMTTINPSSSGSSSSASSKPSYNSGLVNDSIRNGASITESKAKDKK